MAKKCKKGYKHLAGKCEKKSVVPFLTIKEATALRVQFFKAILLLGAWSIFYGIAKFFKLFEASPVILIVVGVVVTLASVRFAFLKAD